MKKRKKKNTNQIYNLDYTDLAQGTNYMVCPQPRANTYHEYKHDYNFNKSEAIHGRLT